MAHHRTDKKTDRKGKLSNRPNSHPNPGPSEPNKQATSTGDHTSNHADDNPDMNRRRMLTAGVSLVGGLGAGATAWPFIASMNPSARAYAIGAPVTVDISKLREGEMLRDQWRGKPVWIVRRTREQIKTLRRANKQLRDPASKEAQQPGNAANYHRSLRPDILVLVGICTHLGCSPTFRPEIAPDDLGKNWDGGFFCACHGSRFDLAGRVYKNVPAPKNLEVPPHRFADNNTVIIGESDEGTA